MGARGSSLKPGMRYKVSVEFSNPFIIFSGRKNPHEVQCSIKMPLLNLIQLAVRKLLPQCQKKGKIPF